MGDSYSGDTQKGSLLRSTKDGCNKEVGYKVLRCAGIGVLS